MRPGSAPYTDRLLTAPEFFSRARRRLTFDAPAGFADPDVIPRHDQHDADPALIAAFAAVRPVRTAAVLIEGILAIGAYQRAGGRTVTITSVVADLTGRPPRTLQEFARDHAAVFRG